MAIVTKKPETKKPKTSKKTIKKRGNKGGRPTKMDEKTLKKLEEGFSLGLPDEQACLYANIAPKTMYNYQDKHPKFVQRKNALKQNITMHARLKVAKAVMSGFYTDDAWKWLEKKERAEFGKDSLDVPLMSVNVVIGLPQLPSNPSLPNGTETDNKPRLLIPDAV